MRRLSAKKIDKIRDRLIEMAPETTEESWEYAIDLLEMIDGAFKKTPSIQSFPVNLDGLTVLVEDLETSFVDMCEGIFKCDDIERARLYIDGLLCSAGFDSNRITDMWREEMSEVE